MGLKLSKSINNNKTFLETFSKYLSTDQFSIRIYHKSSIYFYKHQINHKILKSLFCYEYYIKTGNLQYYDMKQSPKGFFFWISIVVNSVLNDFDTFKLKKKDDIWVFYAYRKEDLAVDTIERYWKKYRWNYFRNKIEPLKRDLMEWKYHPSRLTFLID
jgi:hypothetical protein